MKNWVEFMVEVQIRIFLMDKVEVHRQSHFDFLNNAYWVSFIWKKQLASQDMFLVRFKLSITAYLFLVLYRSTSLTHYRFSKIWRPFCASWYWWIIIVFLQRNSLTIAIVSQKYRDLLQPYSNDRFSKNIKNFHASRK